MLNFGITMGRKKKSAIEKSLATKKGPKFEGQDTYIIIGIILLILSLLSFAGVFIHINALKFLYIILGEGIIVFAIFSFLLSLRFLGTKIKFNTVSSIIGLFIFIVSILSFINLIYSQSISFILSSHGKAGGAVGYIVSEYLRSELTRVGSIIILIPIIIISLMMSLSFSFLESIRKIKESINYVFERIQELSSKEPKQEKKEENNDNIQKIEFEVTGKNDDTMVGSLSGKNTLLKKNPLKRKTEIETIRFDNWELPSINFLNEIKRINVVNNDDIKRNSEIIERTLESFNIVSRVVDISIGPVITRYALQIKTGTKVSKINTLSRDIALALAAPSGSVRIDAPIPGTSLVGIEMPNPKSQIVSFKNLINSSEFNDSSNKIPLAMGEDVTGEIIIKDLSSMPHLLVAGSTGSGKSMLINSFLLGLLYKHSPDTLKLILVDPKHVELSVYNGIPHLLTPVITDMNSVNNALKWSLVEMTRRYDLLKNEGVRNIDGYNAIKEKEDKLSNIIIVIDEMADLMLTKGVEIENSIVRLAQMARAVGIHLILATQRPSVNVITGLIKANIPARIALSVSSSIDSRVILDQMGAETLLGKGDMLFKSPDLGRTIRLQGPLVTEEEISRVITFISKQGVEFSSYNEEILKPQNQSLQDDSAQGSYEDPLFPDAVRVVVNAKRGSASILQSKLKIGYARAARLIYELESNGVVGPQDGSKPREVLIDDADNFLSE
jgi:S-DNA-T family DNA segregation ATPase FtsK/SpoIIIE